MPARSNETLMTALGFPRAAARLYERLLLQDGQEVATVALAMDLTVPELTDRMAPLVAAEVVVVNDGRLLVHTPATVVAALISATSARASDAAIRLQEIASALPYLGGIPSVVGAPELDDPIDGEVKTGSDWTELARATLRSTLGDVLWLRPDQWRQPWESEMHRLVADQLAEGRSIRAIYPVHVLTDAPGIVRARAEVGEEVRLLPEVPTRMVVFGTSHLLLPEPLGFSNSPRTVVRQRGLVELAILAFEQLWAQATPLSSLDGESATTAGNEVDELRRFLLIELARGSQDEQIARRLGISLRTVRRRVAAVMEELGAQSRFQAGVEAARRGWL